MEIPYIIHEYWHSRRMPPGMAKVIHDIHENNPEYDLYVYSETEARQFLVDHFDRDVVDSYDVFKPCAYRSDLFRYCVLYVKGGIWIDTKMEFTVPLRQIAQKGEMYLRTKDGWCGGNGIANGFLIVKPGSPIMKECIRRIVEAAAARDYKKSELDVTGPCLVGDVLTEAGHDVQAERCVCSEADHRFVFHCDGQEVSKSYKEYRADQKLLQKVPHYKELYRKRDIYW
jgi:mannosyltransferase OCH1-like enzyme